MAKPEAKQSAAKPPGHSEEDFDKTFDPDIVIPNKIRTALSSMGVWLTEQEFLRHAGLSTVHLSAYREQFAEHIVEVKRNGRGGCRIWFSDKDVAERKRAKQR